ncbi:MAG: hypothetical protein WC516_05835 [Patescibacteria group bacterium]
MSLTVYVNTGATDVEVGTSGSEWTSVDETADEIIFTNGGTGVTDGDPLPSETELNAAGLVLLTPRVEQTITKYFLADNDANELKQINNMGAGNYRYVMAFSFNASTVSEPVLEVWDDSDLDSIDLVCLGAGTAASSWFRGITTTDALPGAGWTGSRLAGSADGNFLWLNNQNGALAGADVLYCQLKIVIPSTQTASAALNPVMVVKYTSV